MNFASTLHIDTAKLQHDAVSPKATHNGLKRVVRKIYEDHYRSVDAAVPGNVLDSLSMLSVRNIEQVIATVLETKFGRLFSDDLIPIGAGGVAPYAGEIVYERVQDSGLADWVRSADMPWADVTMVEERRRIYTLGQKVGWSIIELEEARYAGKSLDASKLRAQRRGVESSRDMVMIKGDSGFPSGGGLIDTGFINDPNVPSTSALGGVWTGLTNDEVIQALLAALAAYDTNNRDNMEPTDLVLPRNQYMRLMEPRSGTTQSIRDYVLQATSIRQIHKLPDLQGAGTGSADRMILYARNEEVLQGIIPLPFRTIGPEESGLSAVVYAMERMAGLVVKMPVGILYVDGI